MLLYNIIYNYIYLLCYLLKLFEQLLLRIVNYKEIYIFLFFISFYLPSASWTRLGIQRDGNREHSVKTLFSLSYFHPC